ncbi:unknown [Bacteroides sp. CAG:462]|nr:unknown [Bacteroides sp. CAG:462]
MHCKVGAKLHILSLFTKHSFTFLKKGCKKAPACLSCEADGSPICKNDSMQVYLMFGFSLFHSEMAGRTPMAITSSRNSQR